MIDDDDAPGGFLHMTAAILAGGASRRMGRDKALVSLAGVPLVERQIARLRAHFACVLVVATDAERLGALSVPVVPDEGGPPRGAAGEPRGPLGGIAGALRAAPTSHVFVCGVDMPFVSPALVRYMASLAPGFDVVAPETQTPGRSAIEPLHAIYRKSCLDALRQRLGGEDRKVENALAMLRVRRVAARERRAHDPGERSLLDIDTPEDLVAAERAAREEALAEDFA